MRKLPRRKTRTTWRTIFDGMHELVGGCYDLDLLGHARWVHYQVNDTFMSDALYVQHFATPTSMDAVWDLPAAPSSIKLYKGLRARMARADAKREAKESKKP